MIIDTQGGKNHKQTIKYGDATDTRVAIGFKLFCVSNKGTTLDLVGERNDCCH